MDAFVIQGGRRLRGRLRIGGAKNAALPVMAAALLTDEPVKLRDLPNLSDVSNLAKLLGTLGCDVQRDQDQRVATITVTDPSQVLAHYDIVRTMRASICVLGPMLARRGRARVSMPGGCNIGDRPVDLHLRGLRALGAQIHLEEGYIVAEARRLRGKRVFLGGPFGSSVLGTENVMSAATLAQGTTILESAACEPEVTDLADLLNRMGARISGAGSPRIVIEGVDNLHGAEHTILPDRIEAGTYIMAAAITNGDVVLDNCPTDALTAVLDRLSEVGVEVEEEEGPRAEGRGPGGKGQGPRAEGRGGEGKGQVGSVESRVSSDPTPDTPHPTPAAPHPTPYTLHPSTIRIASSRRLEPVQVVTQPYPGFPTDLQAQIMALLCFADGNSIITEKIFPDRFLHVAELLRMGAQLMRNGPSVLITGSRHLSGAPVMASDLRASAGLVLAGLAAKGTTTVNRVYHLDRGYEKMEVALQQLGADIQRVDRPAV